MIVDENGMCTLSEEDCSYHSRTVKQTNADRIRAKSVEEMAEFLTLIMMGEERSVPFIYSTVDRWLNWLKQEVSTNG